MLDCAIEYKVTNLTPNLLTRFAPDKLAPEAQAYPCSSFSIDNDMIQEITFPLAANPALHSFARAAESAFRVAITASRRLGRLR